MSDIMISGGGSTKVATAELLDHSARLARVASVLDDCASKVRACQLQSSGASLPAALSGRANDSLSRALVSLDRAQALSASLHHRLDEAAEAYGLLERQLASAREFGSALLSWGVGRAIPFVLPVLLGLGVIAAGGFLMSGLVTGSAQRSWSILTRWLASQRGILSNPLFVNFVRTEVSSVDDGILGALGVPFGVTRLLDDRALGWFGLTGAAGTIIGLAGPALKETGVSVAKTRTGTGTAPGGYAQLAERIPQGEEQLRIECYSKADGRPGWIVYAGGTKDPGLVAQTEPWDDTSNLQGIADESPASVRATLQAMKDAGIDKSDDIMLVGYSQGGIVATDVIRQGGYDSASLLTFGSPTGQMALPANTLDVAVELDEDIIPALGGEPLSADQGGLDRILVRRSLGDELDRESENPLVAHGMSGYRVTAQMMDEANEPRLNSMKDRLARVTGGSAATVTMWRADREPISSSGGDPYR